MYNEYFSLTESPFSIAPDPRYLYMSERHREALAHLVYGLNSDGAFILLSGDVGTGKTTVSRCLLEQIPENTHLALVLNPKVSAKELLQTICDELHIIYSQQSMSIKDYVDLINAFLLEEHARGNKTVVLIEEVQNIDLEVLEQLRLLTNLETNERKLLQIILLGQPEFLNVLQRPELSQLAQRITARYHLKPLNYEEMLSYISHRLAVAGCRQPLFKRSVLKRLYKISQGIPRVINLICDRSLLGCYVQNKMQVDRATLENAAVEVLGEHALAGKIKSDNKPGYFKLASFLMVTAVLILAIIQFYFYPLNNSTIETPAASTAQITDEDGSPLKEDAIELPDKLMWPDDTDRLRSNSIAFQQLFSRWKFNYDPQNNGTPCFFAQLKGLSCLHGNGDIKELREFNRPAVLQLKDEQGQIHFATLTAAGHQLVTIELAGEEQIWKIEQLQQHWSGDFTLLWKHPPGYYDPISQNHEGLDVVWLSQKLNQIDQSNKLPEASVYQGQLIEKVRHFQHSQGLVADGVVGVQTLIRINNVTGLDVPLLKMTDS